MIYDELIGEIYWVIGKIQSDPELEDCRPHQRTRYPSILV